MELIYFNILLSNTIMIILLYLILYTFYPKYFINNKIKINSLDNLVYIKSNISNKSINNTINKINTYLENNTFINIYFHSTGGDYEAGIKFIDYLIEKQKNNIKFICFGKYIGSIAFTIYQFCDKRYVMYSTIFYQQDLKITTSGSIEYIEDWYNNIFNKIKNKYFKIKRFISDKINLSPLKYDEKIKDGWVIIGGISIVYNNLADQIVN